jgi:hypothetical protein
MGLPACQQRVLDRMEGALKASEPHLTAMFAIFTRLSAGEPVGAESLAGRPGRRWWLRPGPTLAALVLVPVMFALVITGVLLGTPTHASTCAVGMPAAVTVPKGSRSSCGASARTGRRSASSASLSSCPASAGRAGTATTAHFTVWARDAQASWPSGASASGLC